jgi:polar amino acid transport system substrate-binding protein
MKQFFFKTALHLLLMSLFLSVSATGAEIKTIRIATPAWEKQTNEDGTGLFFEIIRSVYEPKGIKMIFEIVPWKRAENMVALNRADAMLCVAEQNIGDQLSTQYPIYGDSVVGVFKKENTAKWNGKKSLEGMRAIWLRGYDMHKSPGMEGIKLKILMRLMVIIRLGKCWKITGLRFTLRPLLMSGNRPKEMVLI